MAFGVLFCGIDFAERLSVAGRDKNRIIAKAALAAWRPDDRAVTKAFIDHGFPVRPGQTERADKAGRAVVRFAQLGLDTGHGAHEIAVAVRIFRPIGGVNARLTAKRMNFQTAII